MSYLLSMYIYIYIYIYLFIYFLIYQYLGPFRGLRDVDFLPRISRGKVLGPNATTRHGP